MNNLDTFKVDDLYICKIGGQYQIKAMKQGKKLREYNDWPMFVIMRKSQNAKEYTGVTRKIVCKTKKIGRDSYILINEQQIKPLRTTFPDVMHEITEIDREEIILTEKKGRFWNDLPVYFDIEPERERLKRIAAEKQELYKIDDLFLCVTGWDDYPFQKYIDGKAGKKYYDWPRLMILKKVKSNNIFGSRYKSVASGEFYQTKPHGKGDYNLVHKNQIQPLKNNLPSSMANLTEMSKYQSKVIEKTGVFKKGTSTFLNSTQKDSKNLVYHI